MNLYTNKTKPSETNVCSTFCDIWSGNGSAYSTAPDSCMELIIIIIISKLQKCHIPKVTSISTQKHSQDMDIQLLKLRTETHMKTTTACILVTSIQANHAETLKLQLSAIQHFRKQQTHSGNIILNSDFTNNIGPLHFLDQSFAQSFRSVRNSD